jgi:uncharacterized protein YndB with AHSA1/START domain
MEVERTMPVKKASKKATKPRTLKRPPSRERAAQEAVPVDTIKLAYLFRDTKARDIYRALTDSAEHTRFTGGRAQIEARVGGKFRCFDGFITGKTLELVPDARIVQSWRTQHFPKNTPDSTLELTLTPLPEGTRLDMRHIDVPKDQVGSLADGWLKFYWDRLARHLGKRISYRPLPL